jgi:hypothetical protein
MDVAEGEHHDADDHEGDDASGREGSLRLAAPFPLLVVC